VQHEPGNVAVRLRFDLYTLLHKIFVFEYNCSHKYGVIPGELPRRERLHTFCIANFWHYKEVAHASHCWIGHGKTAERICRSLMIVWVSQFLIKSGKCRYVCRLSPEEWYGRYKFSRASYHSTKKHLSILIWSETWYLYPSLRFVALVSTIHSQFLLFIQLCGSTCREKCRIFCICNFWH